MRKVPSEPPDRMPNRWLTFCTAVGSIIGNTIVILIKLIAIGISSALTVLIGYWILRWVGLL